MRIVVMDGMGGGLGAQIVARLRPLARDKDQLIALGTNAIATAAMVKAGAHVGATGENAILLNVGRADLVLGPVGVAIPHSLMGEITPGMAAAVALSPARKILVPMTQTHGHFELVGLEPRPLAASLDDLTERVRRLLHPAHP
jgi:L-ascorbate metabolism protein UlaG (beta-lactamase superfamily)